MTVMSVGILGTIVFSYEITISKCRESINCDIKVFNLDIPVTRTHCDAMLLKI